MPGFINYPAPNGQTIMRKEGAAVLWKTWRLLENRELYNLNTDPLQKIMFMIKIFKLSKKWKTI
ncbi:MAG: hypothetical protein IPL55_07450 [Saprospiraceae bacterium]|nr:hypothetical protein [Saprospiraceae bacterium]